MAERFKYPLIAFGVFVALAYLLHRDPLTWVAGFLVAIGGMIVIITRRNVVLAEQARCWPKWQAKVLRSEVIAVGGNAQDPGSSVSPQVTYSYEVGGRIYHGNRYSYFPAYTRKSARDVVASHPVGSVIDIYVDPIRHEESVVLPGANSSAHYTIAFGLLMLFGGVTMVGYLYF